MRSVESQILRKQSNDGTWAELSKSAQGDKCGLVIYRLFLETSSFHGKLKGDTWEPSRLAEAQQES